MTVAALRYELKDRHNPSARGHRFATLERALKELRIAHPRGRWYVIDRQTKEQYHP